MVKIGIIDSRIYAETTNSKLVNCKSSIQSNIDHGNLVANCIQYEYSNIKIVNYVIIENDNHGKASELINGIEYCIAEKVDIINISAGIENISQEIFLRLKKSCDNAMRQGITIIAAGSNNGRICYPAYFSSVLMVTGKDILVNQKINESSAIIYDSEIVVAKTNYKNPFIVGNSFLCALTTGIYAAFFDRGFFDGYKYGHMESFCRLWKCLYSKGFLSTIHNISDRKSIYCFIRIEKQNVLDDEAIEKLSIRNVYTLYDLKKISEKIIIFGSVSYPINEEIKNSILNLIDEGDFNQIYELMPVFNVYERFQIEKIYGVMISNLYI